MPAGKCESARLRVPPWLKSDAAMRSKSQPPGKSEKSVPSVDDESTSNTGTQISCACKFCKHFNHKEPGLNVGSINKKDTLITIYMDLGYGIAENCHPYSMYLT